MRLELAENYPDGDWLKAWWDGTQAWALYAASGPSSPRPRRPAVPNPPEPEEGTGSIRAAVQRAGGTFLQAHATPQGWDVHWSDGRRVYQTLVNSDLGVLEAGLCLSGQDQAQDLTSLVSLLKTGASE